MEFWNAAIWLNCGWVWEQVWIQCVCECSLCVGQKNVIIADQGFLSTASVSINSVCACAEIVCLYIDWRQSWACMPTHKCRCEQQDHVQHSCFIVCWGSSVYNVCNWERWGVGERGRKPLRPSRALWNISLYPKVPQNAFSHTWIGLCGFFFFFCPPAITLVFFFLRVFRFLSKVMLWCCREYSVLSSAAVFWSIFFLAAFLYLFPSCTAHGKGSQHLSGLSGALLEHKELYHSTDTELMMHR